jgi:hypothetical protein
MKATSNILNVFPKYLFWDMDRSKLSLKRDKEIIIPRALYATTTETFSKDILVLEHYYSKSDILNILKHTKENISNEVCVLVSKRYNTAPFYRYAV